MALTLLADRQYTAPSAADSVAITPNATAWANSAYVTLLASTPAACVLTGVTVANSDAITADAEIDIATGAAAAEVVIATVRAAVSFVGAATLGPTACAVLPIPIDTIGAGVRLSARLRKSGTAVGVWSVGITYLQKPLASAILTTTAVPKTLPSAAVGVTVSCPTPAWTSGAWVQIRAASGAALVITGLVVAANTGMTELEVDLGTGAAAAEVVITTLHLTQSNQGMPCWLVWPTPLDNVAASTRLAARVRGNNASTRSIILSLMVLEKPL